MRKIDADDIMARLEDLEEYEKTLEAAAETAAASASSAVTGAALKLLKYIVDTAPTVD